MAIKYRGISFLRNKQIYNSKAQAMRKLKEKLYTMDEDYDGTIILSRYKDYRDDSIRTITGVVYCDKDGNKSITVFNMDKTMSITSPPKSEKNTEYERTYTTSNAV